MNFCDPDRTLSLYIRVCMNVQYDMTIAVINIAMLSRVFFCFRIFFVNWKKNQNIISEMNV